MTLERLAELRRACEPSAIRIHIEDNVTSPHGDFTFAHDYEPGPVLIGGQLLREALDEIERLRVIDADRLDLALLLASTQAHVVRLTGELAKVRAELYRVEHHLPPPPPPVLVIGRSDKDRP